MQGEARRRMEDETEDEAENETPRNVGDSEWKKRFAVLRGDNGVSDGGGRGALRLRPFIIHPDNRWYVVWTRFILIWAVYSSFVTPLEFGFFRGLPKNLFLLDIAGQIVFLFDIFVRFFLAYRDHHSYRIVDDHRLIASRYLKSRFTVDLLGCLPWDAIFKACGRKEPVRYLLFIRLSRALRVTEFFEKLEKDIRVNYLFTRIVKLLVVELYCTHTAACIFYYLATTVPSSKEGYTWIGSLQMGAYRYSDFRDIDLWKRYVTSLYFAIVTMATVGYGDIHPVNVREMIFVMIYVSFDMILGAYLLGNMTALIVKGSKTERFRDKMAELIKYMNRNNLERKISSQIKSHLRLQYDRSYNEAAVLQDIPVSIRAKISQKLYEPFIKEVSLFNGCSSRFIKQIAIRVHEELFLPGEVIIEQGSVVDQIYIVCHGELEEVGKWKDDESEECRLQANSLVGEVSFLCSIVQPYTIKVCELSRVLRLDRQSFMEILEIYLSDARIIFNNLLEGRDSNFRDKLLESEITLFIGKQESELVTRLNCAANDGDSHRLKCLIAAGIDPNKTDYDGRSPLHVAASRGYEDITVFLIERGLNVNIADKFGNTPLFEAIKNGHDEVVSLLVKSGASLTIIDAGGFLCMTVARRDLNLLRRVLANGINPNAKNYDSRTPLHIAAAEGSHSAVNLLLEAGACVLSKDRWGNTPINEARIGGDKGLINLLEVSRIAQMSELSNSTHGIQGPGTIQVLYDFRKENHKLWKSTLERKKCTVFPYPPWDPPVERKQGIVMWVPETMDELLKAATVQFGLKTCSCILSEDGGKILDVSLINNEQKLYLSI